MKTEIVHHKSGGVTFAGKDAVRVAAGIALASSLMLYATSGIIPTRGVGIKRMLEIAGTYLPPGTKFPRTRFGAKMASLAMTEWARTERAKITEYTA